MRPEGQNRIRAATWGARLALTLALFTAMPSVARAATRRARVAIVYAEGMDERQGVVRDLALEFRAEGFDVRSIDEELDDAPLDEWADRARDDGDRALIHVVPGSAGNANIEVLLVKPDSLVLKDTIRRQSTDASDMASVRAVEVTRAALMEVKEAQTPTAEIDIVRDDPYAALAPPRARFMSASVAPVLALTGESMLTLLDLGMSLSWAPSEYIALEVEGGVPLATRSESAPEGTVYVKAGFVQMGASLIFARRDSWLRPYFAVRTGAVFFSIKGVPTTLFVSTSETSISFLNTAALGASIELYGSLRLRAEASIGVSASPPVINLEGKEIDRLGLPIAFLRAGPEITW